jgi:hypothetical protein
MVVCFKDHAKFRACDRADRFKQELLCIHTGRLTKTCYDPCKQKSMAGFILGGIVGIYLETSAVTSDFE